MLPSIILLLEFIILFLSLYFFKQLKKDDLGRLSYFWGMVFVIDFIGYLLSINGFRYIFIYYGVFLILQNIGYVLIINSLNKIKLMNMLLGMILIFGIFEILSGFEFNHRPNKTIGLLSFLIFVNGIYFIYHQVVVLQKFDFFKQFNFWLIFGITIYNALESPYMFFINTLQYDYPQFMNIFSVITTGSSILMYICLIKGLLCYKTTSY